jgi:multiple sugar transport system substrate-binding protein
VIESTDKEEHMKRRNFVKGVAAGVTAGFAGLRAPVVLGQAKPFAGVTINGAAHQHPHHNYLMEYLPEFEARTGMKVNFDTPAFPIYNQRVDLELSTKGSAWDFVSVTFIYSGRWIGAGWLTPLDEFTNDRNATPPDWDPRDFVDGTQSPLKDDKGMTYGFAWEAGAMMMAASRGDLIEKAGLKMPETFAELVQVCEAVHNKEGVAAFVADKLHHWNWPPFLMGFGGRVFKDPPKNLTPVLDTPEAARAAEWYANLLATYCPSGVLSYTDPQAIQAQSDSRANIRSSVISFLMPLAKNKDSKVKSTVRFALMPGGPAGAFPGSNSNGFAIPIGAKQKRAAWEFIKWAMSKETQRRVALEKGYAATCRRSIITDPAYREGMTLNGQDVASLYLKVLELAGKTGYMKYRTVPVFPQVGEKINKAIEVIATKQMSAEAAMKQAQAETIADLKKAGVPLDL